MHKKKQENIFKIKIYDDAGINITNIKDITPSKLESKLKDFFKKIK